MALLIPTGTNIYAGDNLTPLFRNPNPVGNVRIELPKGTLIGETTGFESFLFDEWWLGVRWFNDYSYENIYVRFSQVSTTSDGNTNPIKDFPDDLLPKPTGGGSNGTPSNGGLGNILPYNPIFSNTSNSNTNAGSSPSNLVSVIPQNPSDVKWYVWAIITLIVILILKRQ